MLVALANDLVLLFVGLELISIPTYVLLYLGRGDKPAGVGHEVLLLEHPLVGPAALRLQLSVRRRRLDQPGDDSPRRWPRAGPERAGMAAFAPLALVLIFAGLGFRLTAVPFHFYAPDVYQGTTNPNAGLAGRGAQDRRRWWRWCGSPSWPCPAWNGSAGSCRCRWPWSR